jgi:hypothetical protein
VGVLLGHPRAICALALATGFGLLVSGDLGGTVILWDLGHMAIMHIIQSREQDGAVTARAASSANGDVAVARSGDRVALELLSVNGESVTTWRAPLQEAAVACMAFVPYNDGAADPGLLLGMGSAVLLLNGSNLEVLYRYSLESPRLRQPAPAGPMDGTQVTALLADCRTHRFMVGTQGGCGGVWVGGAWPGAWRTNGCAAAAAAAAAAADGWVVGFGFASAAALS